MNECPQCNAPIETDDDACLYCGTLFRPTRCGTHPDREAVARCVLCRRPLCRRCDHHRGGGVHLCDEHRHIMVIEGWVQVYSTGDEIEAQLIQDNLESEGIDAQVFSQKDHAFSVGFGGLSPVRILVPIPDYEPALAVLRGHVPRTGDVEFGCPECGEAVEPGATRCPACGAELQPES